MTVVSDSSPLITLARIGCFELLPKLYGRIYISREVYNEVVVDGVGLPGANETARSNWIEVRDARNSIGLAEAVARAGLSAGEISAVALATELSADLVLIDEWRARRYAHERGLAIIGCVGVLEDLYEHGHMSDLRGPISDWSSTKRGSIRKRFSTVSVSSSCPFCRQLRADLYSYAGASPAGFNTR